MRIKIMLIMERILARLWSFSLSFLEAESTLSPVGIILHAMILKWRLKFFKQQYVPSHFVCPF